MNELFVKNFGLLISDAQAMGKKILSSVSKIVFTYGLLEVKPSWSEKTKTAYIRISVPAGSPGCPEGGSLMVGVSSTGWPMEKVLAHGLWRIVKTELEGDFTAPDGKVYAKGSQNIKAYPALTAEV